MSHQGYEGWFPGCLVCGMGNLGGIICLSPAAWDDHDFQVIRGSVSGVSPLRQAADGHWWKEFLLCDQQVLADPNVWGSMAFCIGCWNHFAARGLHPPATAIAARRLSEVEWDGLPRP